MLALAGFSAGAIPPPPTAPAAAKIVQALKAGSLGLPEILAENVQVFEDGVLVAASKEQWLRMLKDRGRSLKVRQISEPLVILERGGDVLLLERNFGGQYRAITMQIEGARVSRVSFSKTYWNLYSPDGARIP